MCANLSNQFNASYIKVHEYRTFPGTLSPLMDIGGGAIWTLNQGDGTVSRIDVRTKKLVTNIDAGVPGGGGEIAYGEGSVWVTVFEFPLTQIDPDTNKVEVKNG